MTTSDKRPSRLGILGGHFFFKYGRVDCIIIECQIFVVDSIREQEKSSGSYSAQEMSVYLRSCVHKQVKTKAVHFETDFNSEGHCFHINIHVVLL